MELSEKKIFPSAAVSKSFAYEMGRPSTKLLRERSCHLPPLGKRSSIMRPCKPAGCMLWVHMPASNPQWSLLAPPQRM